MGLLDVILIVQIILKLFGLITMLIDHIGYCFFPNILILRYIGRLAMPIFCFCIAEGYRNSKGKKVDFKYKTYDKDTIYILKLFWFGLISQIPYTLLFDTFQLNQ